MVPCSRSQGQEGSKEALVSNRVATTVRSEEGCGIRGNLSV